MRAKLSGIELDRLVMRQAIGALLVLLVEEHRSAWASPAETREEIIKHFRMAVADEDEWGTTADAVASQDALMAIQPSEDPDA